MTQNMDAAPENLGAETPSDGPTAPDPTQTTGEVTQAATGDTSGQTGESGAEGEGAEADPSDFEYQHDTDDTDDDVDQDGDGSDISKVRREAARHRQRARDTANEAAQLGGLLNQTRQRFLEDQCRQARLDPRLMSAAGLDAGQFVDEQGMLDTNAIAESIEQVRDEFRVPRGYGRNRAQDKSGGLPPKTGLADAFRR